MERVSPRSTHDSSGRVRGASQKEAEDPRVRLDLSPHPLVLYSGGRGVHPHPTQGLGDCQEVTICDGPPQESLPPSYPHVYKMPSFHEPIWPQKVGTAQLNPSP